MTDWRLWPAAKGDEAVLSALEQRVFGARSWGAESLKGSVGAAGVHILLGGRQDGEALGFIIWRDLSGEAEILTIGVDVEVQRGGLASCLLSAVARAAGEMDAMRLFLEVDAGNAPALGLYRKHGFVDIGLRKGYYRDGADACIMALELVTSA